MFKITLILFYTFFIFFGYNLGDNNSGASNSRKIQNVADTLRNATSWPDELNVTHFAGPGPAPVWW